MEPDFSSTAAPRTVDVTGLPESVVLEVEQIVNEARGVAPLTPPIMVIRRPQGPPAPPTQTKILPVPTFVRRSTLSPEEFGRLLDEMAAMGMGDAPPLPADWSRADLYDDHD